MYKEIFNLKNKVVVVCGANGLIGKEIVKCLLDQNAKVVAVDIVKPNFSDERVSNLVLDINSEKSLLDVIQTIKNEHGKFDSWINTAYPRTKDWGKRLEDADLEWFNTNTQLHLGGYFLSSKMVLEEMVKWGAGNLINFSSIYGVLGPNFSVYEGLDMTNPVAYSAIKAGIINLSRYFATYYGPKGIRVNTISPGGVFDNQNPEFVNRYNELTPMRRMARKEEIASATVFLVSDAASYMTGHNLIVDGGWTSH